MASIVALMMELKPALMLQPQSVKAIVLASCHKKANPATSIVNEPTETMGQGITDRQGAGIPDAWTMAEIILQGNYHQLSLAASHSFTKSVTLSCKTNYNMNFSITWLKENYPNTTIHYNNSHITSVPIPNLDLYYVQNSAIKSELTNSSTEMCYVQMPQGTNTYSFEIRNKDTSLNAKVAYAWSTTDREKELYRVKISGKVAVNQTLTANPYCDDGTHAPNSAVTYQWKQSTDNVNWQSISNATAPSYTLTNSDFMKYIKCEVTPNNMSIVTGSMKSGSANTRIVVFGDADLDGYVTIVDSTHIQRYLVGLVTFTPEKCVAADVDGDGNITLDDVMLIQRYLLGEIDCFPVEG